MSNISVTTQQSVIAVTQTSGISVVTPTGQTIDVTVPNSTVNVTNTTDDITILTAGTLNINSSGVVTSVNGNTGPIVVLDTDDIAEGTNKYFSAALARASISSGTGVSYDSGTGVISIGQAVGTTATVTFGSVGVDGVAVQDTAVLTTSSTTANQVLDSFSAATYRTAKYLVSISSGTDYHSIEILVNHNGTTANSTSYADLPTGSSLAAFGVDISGGLVRLLTTPTNAVTAYRVTRTTLVV
jgi:hypothetical protein